MVFAWRVGRRLHGFSVPELLVASALLSILMALAFGAIAPGLRVTKEAEEDTASQREVVFAFDRLFQEMSLMDRASVSHSTGNLAFLSKAPYSGLAVPIPDSDLDIQGLSSLEVWRKHVLLHLRDKTLWRREFSYTKGRQIGPMVPDMLEYYGELGSVAEKTFARNIEHFESSSVGRSRVAIRVRSVHRGAKRPEACEVTMQVSMRGGL